ncbi:MAG: 50S ribosomal protein L17 [Candidatus Cloacimonadota bacterium]|nr:MAG: 50S ribosomal protein L17 [Candidatus Cloacimonadota bacterium]PIE79147.1 MAG: 50S ribosomal protein L17 [Candidatus Delongbacteria bacterium]
MRHAVRGRKLNKTASHRKAMLANLCSSLFEHKKITTTLAKAKETRRFAEKLITFGKKGDLNSLRQVLKFIRSKEVARVLFKEIAPSYNDRNGGYTRVVKIGTRKGDAAEMAVIQLVGYEDFKKETSEKSEEKSED